MSDDSYFRVGARVWRKPWDEQTRTLAFYLLTCPHRTTEGLYYLPTAYALADLGWKPARLKKVLQQLVDEGFVQWDPDAQVVFLVNALAWQAPGTERHVTGAIRRLRAVPQTCLANDFWKQAECHAPALANRKAEVIREA